MNSPASSPFKDPVQPETSTDSSQKGLGKTINAETRLLHRTLNKQILDRLPLALPPRAQNPSLYVTGILHIASVYIGFETLWRKVLVPHPKDHTTASDLWWTNIIAMGSVQPKSHLAAIFSPKAAANRRVFKLLAQVHDPKLERSARLVGDIRAMTGWSQDEVADEIRRITSRGAHEKHLHGGDLANFIMHMSDSVSKAPHVLLAYGWVMYMALFSGGRFIRATLETATSGPARSFWTADPGRIRPGQRPSAREPETRNGEGDPEKYGAVQMQDGEHPMCSQLIDSADEHRRLPLEFLHFATERDGEDLKEEFKRRLSKVDASLTPGQRSEVVQEALFIFNYLILVVGNLDDLCDTPAMTGLPPQSGKSVSTPATPALATTSPAA